MNVVYNLKAYDVYQCTINNTVFKKQRIWRVKKWVLLDDDNYNYIDLWNLLNKRENNV